MNLIRCLLIVLFLSIYSCKKERDKWFQKPPVSPVNQTIKTIVPIGYAASLAMLKLKGYNIPYVTLKKEKSTTLLYINTERYPYKFKGDDYGSIVVAALKINENTALMSVFFTESNISSSQFKLQNIIAFPVIYNNDKITAIYSSMDINVGSNSNIGLSLSSEEINECLAKLENKRMDSNLEGYKAAIEQNAWIVDVYHKGTFENFNDDKFKIYGGQQSVEVENFETESSAGVLQMAMIADFSSYCLKNPTHGYVFMQDVEVESSNVNIVFGHVFYEFHPSCDGEILVDVATGNFIFAIGKEIDLGLI